MLIRIALAFALFLASSKRYLFVKHFFRNLLENPNYKYKKYFDFLMIFVVLSSIYLLILEVTNPLGPILTIYNDRVVTTIFVFEYLLRLWVYNDTHTLIIKERDKASFLNHKLKISTLLKHIILKKFEYVRQPTAIIDLLAILPSYRPLRILRVFLLFRVVKLLRYTKSIQSFLTVLYTKKFELYTLLVFSAFIIFISSVLLYVFEGDGKNESINNFADAIYWALVTVSTVGYGDITPVTLEGRIITILVIVAGIGILSFATSIIVSAFTEKLDELRLEQVMKTTEELSEFYLVLGYSSMAQQVLKQLKQEKIDIVVVDTNKDKVVLAQKEGFIAVEGDATKLHTYHEMNLSKVQKIKAALCLINDEVQNVFITLTVKSISPKIPIYSRANTKSVVQKLKLAGAKEVLYAFGTVGNMAKEFVLQPVVFDSINALISGNGKHSISEIKLSSHDLPVGKMLKEIDFQSMKLILLGIASQDTPFVFNPPKEYVLQAYDMILVVGQVSSLEHFRQMAFSKKANYAYD